LVEKGSSQYSDIPLSYFFLATGVLLCLYEVEARRPHLAALAGVAAGVAAWTKNEGMIFLLSLLAIRLIGVIRVDGWRAWLTELGAFGLGLVPALCCLVYLKLRLAPMNDLVEGQGLGPTLERLLAPNRYVSIVGAYLSYGLLIGPATVVVLSVYAFLLGKGPPVQFGLAMSSIIAVLALMMVGYTIAFLTTPHALLWHLSVMDRLYMQLWPLALFAFFVRVATPEEAQLTIQR
jgi:hypothetical protein